MAQAFVVALLVSRAPPPPPPEIYDLVERVRMPRAAFGEADAGPSHH